MKFVKEALGDVLKPKSQEEIDNAIVKKFYIEEIKTKLEKLKGNLFCLYVYDDSWSINGYTKNTEKLFKEMMGWMLESFEHGYRRKAVIYTIDPDEDGFFSDEGSHETGKDGVNVWVIIETLDEGEVSVFIKENKMG